jgi:hypothetical protein
MTSSNGHNRSRLRSRIDARNIIMRDGEPGVVEAIDHEQRRELRRKRKLERKRRKRGRK